MSCKLTNSTQFVLAVPACQHFEHRQTKPPDHLRLTDNCCSCCQSLATGHWCYYIYHHHHYTRLLYQCVCYSACLYNMCVLLTFLHCSSRLPQKTIACASLEKDLRFYSREAMLARSLSLSPPLSRGGRDKIANQESQFV